MSRGRNSTATGNRNSLYRASSEVFPEIRRVLYNVARNSVHTLYIDPQHDPESYHDDRPSATRLSRQLSAAYWSGAKNPFDDSYSIKSDQQEHQNPFHDSNGIFEEPSNRIPGPELEQPYHVFSQRQKWVVVTIIGAAGLFSGLSSNIYFPSLERIAKDLQVSLNAVSLTITSYLIIQGISPLFWGSLSDALGRRPIYVASFSIYIIANIALSFSPNFAVLLIFRGLQAAGSASTVSIGNGVIQDISPPAERATFISFYQAIRNFSIAIGPVLGGLLSNSLGFRSIFVFLLILSSLVLAMIVLLLPETMREIAGNGSLRLTGIYQPLIRRWMAESLALHDPEEITSTNKVTFKTFVEPLKLLFEKDILLNLVFGGVVYTVWSMVTSTTTGLFKSRFGLNELQLGFAFLPNGLGTIAGSIVIGKIMTRSYLAAEKNYKVERNMPDSQKLPTKSLPADFPIERARLGSLPWITVLVAVSTAAYGFSLQSPVIFLLRGWIAVPLILQFFIAASSNAVFAINQTLISDLCPGKGASSTAINNLVRCGLAALGVAFGETMVAALGPGAAFLGLALLMTVFVPLAVVNWYWGPQWRADRTERKSKTSGGEP